MRPPRTTATPTTPCSTTPPRSSSTSRSPSCSTGLAAGDAGVVATERRRRRRPPRRRRHGDPRVHILERGDVYRARTPTAITTFRQLAEQRVGRRRRRASGSSARSTSGRPSATGSSGSATSRSSTRPWPTGRCGGCASSTPSACPSPLLESALHTHSHVVDASGRVAEPDVHAARGLPPLAAGAPPSRSRTLPRGSGPATSPTSSACGMRWPPSWPPSTRPATWSRTSCSPSTR